MTAAPETTAVAAPLGIAWLREEDWPRWRAIDADLPADYAKWRTPVEEAIAQSEAAGNVVVKVTLDPDRFIAWREAANHGAGAHSRKVYVATITRSLSHPDRPDR